MEKDKDNHRIMIANIWETPDGTKLWSRHVHDSVFYVDANGERYMVDGGNDYCHLSDSKEHPMKNCCMFDDEPWEVQRQYRLRGTFDKQDNRVWVPLCKLSNEHLEAILEYNKENCKPLSNIEILECIKIVIKINKNKNKKMNELCGDFAAMIIKSALEKESFDNLSCIVIVFNINELT